jgi:3-oxoacyl-[acyl-carrier protein] reductase
MDLMLKGKRALVLGSSSGIGKAIAQSLIQEGASVALCSRSLDRLAATAREIGAETFIAHDLSKPKAGEIAVKEVIERLGGIDILVTNTGGPAKGGIESITNEQWSNDFQGLWLSVVDSIRAALPSMKTQKFGRILLVTSLAAKEPLNGLTTSNGLRAGLSGLCKSISSEVAPFGITINALLPGYTDTERLQELNLSEERIKQMVPAGRLGRPEELGDLASFLASPKAGYITGQSLVIDGGAVRGY